MTVSGRQRSLINRRNGARRFAGYWTDERVALLRRLWKPGANAQDIADKIGGGCTRMMVIGKADRLGLPALPINKKRKSERSRAAMLRHWAHPAAARRHARSIRAGVKRYWDGLSLEPAE